MRRTEQVPAGFEDGRRSMSQGMWEPLEAGKGQGEGFSSGRNKPCQALDFSPMDPFQTSDPQNPKTNTFLYYLVIHV